jgi:aldose 1-epimerase
MIYQIQHIFDSSKQLNYIEMYNETTTAKIVLNEGASLQLLVLNSVPVIKELTPLAYKDTFASSILFPFASRIKDGKYIHNDKVHQLEINEKKRSNALHGLVYNKEFNLIDQEITKNGASVLLEYTETSLTKGFPFTYSIQLKYILTHDSLKLNVTVLNTSNEVFPFTIGWHPYFFSDNLSKSVLKFDSSKKAFFDDRMIYSGVEEFQHKGPFNIKNKKLDDCFYLNSNVIEFETPNYTLEMISSSENDFLQVYTPPCNNTIAIEPTTGISNSFNSKVGLKELESNESYTISWQIQITNY